MSINSHPLAQTNDGYTDIAYMSKSSGASKCKLINYLLFKQDPGEIFKPKSTRSMENLDKSIGLEYTKTKAFLFIPKKSVKDSDLKALDLSINGDKNSEIKKQKYEYKNFLSIDGEKYETQPFQLLLKASKLKVFC